MFFDLTFSEETSDEKSKKNYSEADFICQLLITLGKAKADNKLYDLKGRIGIISPYKSQVRLL
jgi:superfamily I DNA and/or RNA helicase